MRRVGFAAINPYLRKLAGEMISFYMLFVDDCVKQHLFSFYISTIIVYVSLLTIARLICTTKHHTCPSYMFTEEFTRNWYHFKHSFWYLLKLKTLKIEMRGKNTRNYVTSASQVL
jgi:hypothetical protein